jgi:hypothetical protein
MVLAAGTAVLLFNGLLSKITDNTILSSFDWAKQTRRTGRASGERLHGIVLPGPGAGSRLPTGGHRERPGLVAVSQFSSMRLAC